MNGLYGLYCNAMDMRITLLYLQALERSYGLGTQDQLYTLHQVLEGSYVSSHNYSTCALWI